MRKVQNDIYSAIINKARWMGNNTRVEVKENATIEVYYYWSKIAVIRLGSKTATLGNGGYNTVSTNLRLNAIKKACDYLGVRYTF